MNDIYPGAKVQAYYFEIYRPDSGRHRLKIEKRWQAAVVVKVTERDVLVDINGVEVYLKPSLVRVND